MTQITVSAGSSVNVTLPANNRLVIGGSGIYRVGPLGTSQRPTVDQLIDTTSTVGPFEDSCVVSIRANGGSAVYEVIAPTDALDSRGLPALVSGAGISSLTLAEMLALTPSSDGAMCSVTDLASGSRGLFQWHAASSKWRPASMVLVDRSLTLDSGVNNTNEQYIKSLSIPAGLLFAGCEILLEYTLGRSNTTDAGAAANFRVGNAGTISDGAFGNGSGFISLTGSQRSFGNRHRYRVVSATEIEKVGAAPTAGESFAASSSSVAVAPWTVGSTTQRLYFAPTVQLAAATGTTLPQVGYMALWLLPS